jgi:hypothetical protein
VPINDRMHRACSHLKVSERTVVHEGDAVVGGIVYCNCKPFPEFKIYKHKMSKIWADDTEIFAKFNENYKKS